jgi:hypothetical protein
MANCFIEILKNPSDGFASPVFFGRQVAKIRHKKQTLVLSYLQN